MRIVTFTSPDYVPGTRVLLHSLRKHSKLDAPVTVIAYEDISDKDQGLIERAAGQHVDFMHVCELGTFEFDLNKMANKRRADNLNKLKCFSVPYDDVCLMLDADMLCVRDARALLRVPPLAAGPNLGKLMPESINGRMTFNSGLMIFQPNAGTLKHIESFAATHYERIPRLELGDQDVLNRWVYHTEQPFHMLGAEFNVTETTALYHGRFFEQVRPHMVMFHYTKNKPWGKKVSGKYHRLWHDYWKEIT